MHDEDELKIRLFDFDKEKYLNKDSERIEAFTTVNINFYENRNIKASRQNIAVT